MSTNEKEKPKKTSAPKEKEEPKEEAKESDPLLADIKEDKPLMAAIKADHDAIQNSELYASLKYEYNNAIEQKKRIQIQIDAMKAKGIPNEHNRLRFDLWNTYHALMDEQDQIIKQIKAAVITSGAIDITKLN